LIVRVRVVPTVDDWNRIGVVSAFPENVYVPADHVTFPEKEKITVLELIAPMTQPPQTAVDATVTVPPEPRPEDAVKFATSVAVGATAPEAPPSESDQCVVADPSQVPAPETQYLAAIYQSFCANTNPPASIRNIV
jgi:hypothetical protein